MSNGAVHLPRQELEEIEDRLREESHELVAMVSRLQDENRKLSTSLAKSEGTVIHSNGECRRHRLNRSRCCHRRGPSRRHHLCCRRCRRLICLSKVIRARRALRREIAGFRLGIRGGDASRETSLSGERFPLKSQLEKVNHVNRELRRRQRTYGSQMRSLIDERAELQAALQEETRAVNVLRQRLGLAQKENEDLASSSSDSLDLTNKLVFDRDDPNRPRFTMTELKEILYERNELKARVSDLEDELEMYRPKEERQRSHIICPPVEMVDPEGGLQPPTDPLTPPPSLSDSLSNEIQDAAEEEDPPVQGPMPYEPDDAPWRKGESGIRKFFGYLNSVRERLISGVEEKLLGEVQEGKISS
ncbi:RILP-like protein homolog [Penaeus japonicus]|uniref:RILP-like protein homolog n=1 Tax=Penaeus japonicus TaxID=27405 RepID=UPI001C710AAD|nr:RILP-like protein homolog [Penaeus japonicus]